MSVNHITATKRTWFIIPEINLAGFVETGQNITSVHQVFEFDNEAEWKAKKDELGIEDNHDL